ncbi:hypothetical protein L3Y34_012864 [Caenorhabditis briggsae]|uniref:Uncharacterized protein n=1 Tax=Caenorhabditis briggsae TaxID=6238 RepID=A0AAE9CX58_CAEBR|nr:hypothetical protein L3Y34_012864 [Caenorhabditis briggsae]
MVHTILRTQRNISYNTMLTQNIACFGHFCGWKIHPRDIEEQFYKENSTHLHICIRNCKETYDKTPEGHDKQHFLLDWIAVTIEYSIVNVDSIIQLHLLAITKLRTRSIK